MCCSLPYHLFQLHIHRHTEKIQLSTTLSPQMYMTTAWVEQLLYFHASCCTFVQAVVDEKVQGLEDGW